MFFIILRGQQRCTPRFFMPFTTHSRSLPLLCRSYNPLSQQLRQESGHFLGISQKSPYLCISYLNLTFVHFCINLFLVIGYLVKKRKKARSGESSFFINPIPLHHYYPYNDSCRYHPYHPQRQDQSHAYYQVPSPYSSP